MSEFQPRTDDEFRAAVLRARAMTPDERFAEGLRMSEQYVRDFAALPELEKVRIRQEREDEENLYYTPPFPRLESELPSPPVNKLKLDSEEHIAR